MIHNKQSGFTLVELAIVLVIIGLVVGGVLAGQDLIKAAEIRAVVSDVEKYNAAATTFRNKYNGYPGDLLDARATQFGLESTGADGSDGLGDGDGMLENGPTPADKAGVGGENTLFWVHLSESGLIPQPFSTADGSVAVALANDAAVANYLPKTKLRDSSDVHIFSITENNYFYISGITAVTATTGAPTEINALTPGEAESIDGKIDNGLYDSGAVRAYANIADAASSTQDAGATAAAGVCIDEGAGAAIAGDEVYNVSTEDFATTVSCKLRIRTSF